MNPRLERAVVRLAGIAMFALAVTVAIRTGPPSQPPTWALRSSLIYMLELVLATVGALYALLTVAIHTIVRGAVPTTISKEGFTWAQEVTKVTDEVLASAQEQLKERRGGLDSQRKSHRPRSRERELRSDRMGLFHKLLRRNSANTTAERMCQPDARTDDLLLHLRETQARVAAIRAELEAARARIRELGRRYPYTS